MKKKLFFLFRCLTFLIGMNITACGIATVTNTDLGTTPITSIPYAVNAIFPLTIGVYTCILNILFVIAQRFILGRKGFHLIHVMQLPPVLFFSMSIDFWLHNTTFIQSLPYLEHLLYTCVGTVLMAMGIFVQVASNVIVLPGEGIVLAIAYRSRKAFGSIKVISDSSMVLIAMTISFVGLGTIVGVREGTIITAVFTGIVVRFVSFLVHRVLHLRKNPGDEEESKNKTDSRAKAVEPAVDGLRQGREVPEKTADSSTSGAGGGTGAQADVGDPGKDIGKDIGGQRS